MKIVVLGAGGMLGHKMCQVLGSRGFEVWPVFHKPAKNYRHLAIFDAKRAIGNVDATDEKYLYKILDQISPDVIINCIGLTTRKLNQANAGQIIQINAKLPHTLEYWVQQNGRRLIHFSTDCVFDGKKGFYNEDQVPDAKDLYGKSKFLGEVQGPNSLTLRSSIVGQEIENRTELLEWFLSQSGKTVEGFSNVFYSGVTTNFMAKVTAQILQNHSDLSGVYQIASQKISKFELLETVNNAFANGSEIVAKAEPSSDKTLDGSRFRQVTGIETPSWKDMIQELACEKEFYSQLRSKVELNEQRVQAPSVPRHLVLEGKTILVTGGTGSMGKTFIRRALSGTSGLPKKIIVMSRDEAKQHYMRQDYLRLSYSTDDIMYRNFQNILEFQIGDVRRYEDVCSALRGVDIVVNAAALKQVPICEYFPEQAYLTNCTGAQNIVRAIRDCGFPVETVVGVSTDKACKPVNVMGMTKALQERTFIAGNILCRSTRFVCVRYGNVLASRGSVIPVFHEQIKAKGPVTVTDAEMTRFLLTLEDAVDTVLAAIATASPGEVLVPIAAAATMVNVAKALIGTRAVEIIYTGIRPGEKMHEIMISDEEAYRSYRKGDYYAIQPMLPELIGVGGPKKAEIFGEFSSRDSLLDLSGTIELLKRNGLMIGFNDSQERFELIG